jgi:hypothetical protein
MTRLLLQNVRIVVSIQNNTEGDLERGLGCEGVCVLQRGNKMICSGWRYRKNADMVGRLFDLEKNV